MYKGEFFNSITHIIGAVAAFCGLIVLVVFSARQGDPWKIVSFSIYGATLFILYTFSALYHSLQGKAKDIFRKLDHYAIYFLIAGTYTPFTLVTLRGMRGWIIFSIVWGLAIIGIFVDFFHKKGRRIIPVIIHLIMGWIIIVVLKPLINALPEGGFTWLLVGGIFYTAGIVFYAFDRRIRHFHGIWHLFVLLGSVSHYLTVVLYIL